MSRTPQKSTELARRALAYGSCTWGPSAMYTHTNPDTRARGARTMQKNSEKNEKKATFWRLAAPEAPPAEIIK